jgi:hypothetical protein
VTRLRTLWLVYGALVFTLVPFGIVAVAVFSDPPEGTDPIAVVPVLIFIIAVRAVDHATFSFIERQKPFGGPDATPESLASEYQRRFMLSVAVTSGGTVLGFAGAALTYEPWVYGVSVVAAIPAYLRDAPSSWSIRRRQEEADANGATASLLEGLEASGSGTQPYTPDR